MVDKVSHKQLVVCTLDEVHHAVCFDHRACGLKRQSTVVHEHSTTQWFPLQSGQILSQCKFVKAVYDHHPQRHHTP